MANQYRAVNITEYIYIIYIYWIEYETECLFTLQAKRFACSSCVYTNYWLKLVERYHVSFVYSINQELRKCQPLVKVDLNLVLVGSKNIAFHDKNTVKEHHVALLSIIGK